MIRRLILLSALIVLATSPLLRAGTMVNGSFEQGVDPAEPQGNSKSGMFLTLYAGDPTATDITGWVVVNGSVVVLGPLPPSVDYVGPFWTASDGTRSVDLDGDTQGAIEQTFDTEASKYYQVAFDMAGNTNGPPPIKSIAVSVDNSADTTQDYTFDSTGFSNTNMGWTTMYFDFQATSSSTTLMFESLDAGQYGAALDNVKLSGPSDTPFGTPEPASLLLMGSALAGLAARRLTKRAL